MASSHKSNSMDNQDNGSLAQLEKVLNDGLWIIGRNILSYLDPESLVNVGAASKTANKFVLSYLANALEETYRKNILDLDTTKSTASNERKNVDKEQWANFFALFKNGSISQMSWIMPVIKITDGTITTFNSFHPVANLSYYMLCSDDASDVQKFKTWRAFESLTQSFFSFLTWNPMMWLVLTSRNEYVVRFFTEKLSKINPLLFIQNLSYLGYISHDRSDNHMSDVKNKLIIRTIWRHFPDFWSLELFLRPDND